MSQQFDGKRLMAARRSAGKSREQVAMEIGRSFGSVTLYERGQVVPPGAILGKLADSLGCSVAVFFSGGESEISASADARAVALDQLEAIAVVVAGAPALSPATLRLLNEAGFPTTT